MHIPDAYLSPATQAVAFAAMAPVWFVAARRTRRELTSKQAPLLSMGAAFCFAIQMFNIPAVGGTTAHALGAGLLAILVGPWAAVLGMTLTLVVQALLFGDGGILSLGANCWDMAFVAPFVSYGLYRALSTGGKPGSTRSIVSAGIGAYAGTVMASLSAGILLGIQPGIAHDAAGHALYCPFGLNVSVPAMVMSHLLAAGPAEAIITVAALAYLWRSFPDLVRAQTRVKVGQRLRLARTLGWVLVLTPIGLIAGGDAFGEWDLTTLKQMIGYAPAGISQAHEVVKPLLPDYGFAGLTERPWQIAGYLASALIGCTLVALFTRGIVRRSRVEPRPEGVRQAAGSELPRWLTSRDEKPGPTGTRKSPWLERTVLRMRATIAKTIASEEVARAAGLLQSINPLAKTVGFLCALVAAALTKALWPLGLLTAGVFLIASLSKVPLRSFALRVGGAVLFFGLAIAVPVSLKAVSPGPTVIQLFGVALSSTGLHTAALILLRLAAGISLAMLWNLTTRWFELLRTLRWIGVPQMFLTSATLTYRYIFVTMETLAEMVEARTSRQVGACTKEQARTYAGAGTAILFAKSLAFTEEMHWAMVSRTCDGVRGSTATVRWTAWDSATALAGIFALALVLMQRAFHAV